MAMYFPVGTRERFLELVCSGLSIKAAAREIGASKRAGLNWWWQSGGMELREPRRGGGLADPILEIDRGGPRALTLDQRVMIQFGCRQGLSYAKIAGMLGRNRSVVWREVQRNTSVDGVYYASIAHTKAHQARRRPKSFKLLKNDSL